MPATTTVSQFSRSVCTQACSFVMNSAVMLLGKWSQPRKSLPAHVPASRAFCASSAFGAKAAICSALSRAFE